MSYDCGFTKENNWFRYRTGGFVICDGKMLFVKSEFMGGYYYMVGGGVTLGETSVQCIEREIFEETGMKLKADYLAVVCENFFKGVGGVMDAKDCHVLEFYYVMKVTPEDIKNCKKITDQGEELAWVSVEDIKNVVIKPDFVRERIDEILNSKEVIHVLEERDR